MGLVPALPLRRLFQRIRQTSGCSCCSTGVAAAAALSASADSIAELDFQNFMALRVFAAESRKPPTLLSLLASAVGIQFEYERDGLWSASSSKSDRSTNPECAPSACTN